MLEEVYLVLMVNPRNVLFLKSQRLTKTSSIAKPWPISWVDRHIHGGVGIMLDDILAGVAAWAVMQGLVALLV